VNVDISLFENILHFLCINNRISKKELSRTGKGEKVNGNYPLLQALKCFWTDIGHGIYRFRKTVSNLKSREVIFETTGQLSFFFLYTIS
jgi:hypothetical protein